MAAAVTAREQCKERLDHPGSVGATEAGQVVEDVLRNLDREVATRMVEGWLFFFCSANEVEFWGAFEKWRERVTTKPP